MNQTISVNQTSLKTSLTDVLLPLTFVGAMAWYYIAESQEKYYQNPISTKNSVVSEQISAFDNSINHLRSAVILDADDETIQQNFIQTKNNFEQIKSNFSSHEISPFSFQSLDNQLVTKNKKAFIKNLNDLQAKVSKTAFLSSNQ